MYKLVPISLTLHTMNEDIFVIGNNPKGLECTVW